MPRDQDDYKEEYEKRFEDIDLDDDDEEVLEALDYHQEEYGIIDQLTDLALGEAEIALELDDDDDDLDPNDPEYEIKKKPKSAANKAKVTVKKTAKVGAKTGLKAAKTAATGATLVRNSAVGGVKTAGKAAKAVTMFSPASSFISAATGKGTVAKKGIVQGGAGMTGKLKRVVVKVVIIGVVLGIAMTALRATPFGPIVDKLNGMAKSVVARTIRSPSGGRRGW